MALHNCLSLLTCAYISLQFGIYRRVINDLLNDDAVLCEQFLTLT